MTDRAEIAWAAGLFEGEGTFYLRREAKRPLMTPEPSASMTQVEREVLDRFCAIVGFGKVRGPYGPYSGNRKPYHQWYTHAAGDVRRLLDLLSPWLSDRRKRQGQACLDSELRAA